jgi:hypothetical protein
METSMDFSTSDDSGVNTLSVDPNSLDNFVQKNILLSFSYFFYTTLVFIIELHSLK